MKNTTYILGLCLLVLTISMSSCKDYLADETATPNNPTEVGPALLLSSAQVSTFATYSGQLVRQSSTFTQQLAGTAAGSQSIEIANYTITESTNINEWEGIYAGAVTDCNIIIEEYGSASPYYAGIAKVIKVLNLGAATDLWGDVPFTEASMAGFTGNVEPAFDPQAAILVGIGNLLDEAIDDLSADLGANELVPTSDDLLFGGDVSAWIKTANVLKARYANRTSQVDPAGSATAVIDALSGAYDGSADDAFMPFFGGNAINQWFAFESSRASYYKVGSTFVDLLTNNNDPRLSVLVAPDNSGSFSGTPFDDVTVDTTSYVGDIYATASAPLPLVTYVEQKFLEAEALLRLSDGGSAATAHNEAVMASVMQLTGETPSDEFITAYASEDGSTITLEKIMIQKYIALFIQLESYSDWRRTGFPALTANPNGSVPGIPLRLPTPQDERLYNSNAVVVSDLLQPVFWDQ